MPLLSALSRLVKDPSPDYVFELSEAGLAYSRPASPRGRETGFAAFEPGTLAVSPVADNIRKGDVLAATLERVAPRGADARKRSPAALILPDYAARVTVLDFDTLPATEEEQAALVRFRLKKSLPFDIEAAAVTHFVQPGSSRAGKTGTGKTEVVAVAVALEVIARYEALFRGANFHPGEITTSALAALQLYNASGAAVIAKLAGRVLTVMVVLEGSLKLFRCVELERAGEEEILSVLQPTIAYAEDALASPDCTLVLCGFGAGALSALPQATSVLSSKLGAPDGGNAGLFGYLEGALN